jgi:hypothetical protein
MPAPAFPAPNADEKDPRPFDFASLDLEGPPEEEFWERYNKRLEFPVGLVAAVFLHIVVAALIVLALMELNSDEDRANPPLQLMQVGGLDDSGEGSAGSGGTDSADKELNADPFKSTQQAFKNPQQLADAKENIKQWALDDPTANVPISARNAEAFKELDESIAKKLLGGRKGDGPYKGKGFDGTAGSGPGGTGADSTRARGLRWVLRFRIVGGRDYLDQLRAMGAEILVPLPPDGKKCLIIRDLNNPRPVTATDEDLNRLAGKIQFSDNRPAPVREVLGVLGVDTSGVKAFWAFFPKEIEDDLARKEKGYRNRRPEDVEETVFRVTIRAGSFEVVVDDQTVKR